MDEEFESSASGAQVENFKERERESFQYSLAFVVRFSFDILGTTTVLSLLFLGYLF